MQRALVIAGYSFVGRHLAGEFRNSGFDVTITARRVNPGDQSARACDILDRSSVEHVIRLVRPDVVIQCAGITDPNHEELARQVHIAGTTHVLEAVREYASESVFVALGSAAEYGPASVSALPLNETYEPQPGGTYGETKLAQTKLVERAAAAGQRAYVVRPFNIIGPGLPAFYFAAGLARRLREFGDATPREFDVFNAQATRDFIDVRDVARAVRLLCVTRPTPGDSIIYNICTDTQTSLLAVAEFMGNLAGGHWPSPAGQLDSRSGISFSQGSFEKLKRDCDWKPEIDWRTSIRDLWNATT